MNIRHGQKVVSVDIGFVSYIDNDLCSYRLPVGNSLSRPSAFGKMKGSFEVSAYMLRPAIVVRRIPIILRCSTFGDFIQLKGFCRRPVQCIACESMGHIDQLLLLEGIRRGD